MKTALVLVIASVLFAGGCATIQMQRYAMVEIVRSRPELGKHAGITPTLAVEIFREVSDQLGFVIKGPIRVSANETEYSADSPDRETKNQTSLILDMNHERLRISGSVYGTREDLSVARKTIALFEQALDRKGIRYRASVGTAFPSP